MSEATKPKIEEGIEENMLVSWFETKFGFLKPHYKTIAIVGGLLIVGVILFMFLQKMRADNYANQWGTFHQAFGNTVSAMGEGRSNATDHLTDLADQFPDAVSSNWALQVAGDIKLREGLSTLATDRDSALKKIKKAKSHYQAVIDSKAKKTPMLQERSVFGLAYAMESLGDFEKAGSYYEQLIEQTEDDSVFAEAATRGLARTKNPALVDFYANFESKKMGVAPGVRLADRPDIDFPEFDLPDGESFAGPEFLNQSAEPKTPSESPEPKTVPEAGTTQPSETTEPEATEPDTSKPETVRPETTEAIENTPPVVEKVEGETVPGTIVETPEARLDLIDDTGTGSVQPETVPEGAGAEDN